MRNEIRCRERNAESRVAGSSKAPVVNDNDVGFIPLERRDRQTRSATLLKEGQVSLLLLLESGLDQVEGLDKDTGTEPGDGSA